MFTAAALLLVAITAEVVATTALPNAQGFTDVRWTAFVVGGYALSIWLLTLIVKQLPVSVTYAVWAGLGTAAISVVGVVFLGEKVDALKITALALIIAGVVLLNVRGAH
jgi:small multidrug resistance pump